MSMDRVYVAMDQMNLEEVQQLLHNSHGKMKNVKIGLEAYLKYGREFVLLIHERYKTNVFLDLKLHDIPVTVAKAIESLQGLPIAYLTIHLSGGREMIIEAIKARNQFLPNTKLLGVSFLTPATSGFGIYIKMKESSFDFVSPSRNIEYIFTHFQSFNTNFFSRFFYQFILIINNTFFN